MSTWEEKIEILKRYPEMLDFVDIIIENAKPVGKYDMDNWLLPDGQKMTRRENSDSLFHHLADYTSGNDIDHTDGKDHRLKLQCRAAMSYTRAQRGIKHPNDSVKYNDGTVWDTPAWKDEIQYPTQQTHTYDSCIPPYSKRDV